MMPPGLRKFALTAHVTASVGWFGAVVAFLAVAVLALLQHDQDEMRGASIAMRLIGWFVIVPFSVASLVSGVVQSLGTQWRLFQHYWVITKLLITVAATALLLLHMRVVDAIAVAASNDTAAAAGMQGPKLQIVADAIAAVVVLLIAAALSIYKPQGRTGEPAPLWVRVAGGALAAAIAAFMVLHLAGSGMHSHQ